MSGHAPHSSPPNGGTYLHRSIAVVRRDFVNDIDAGDGITTTLRTFDQTQSLHTTPG